jgi:adenosylcobinamide kinase/adenosylcobinamide-phosphate guanylyltransferase
MACLYLVTGGSRSGKSSYALELAESIPGKRLFVATARAGDGEMQKRIERHRREREGRGWQCREVAVDLQKLFAKDLSEYQVVLLDCITLWVSNLLLEERDSELLDEDRIQSECQRWLEEIEKTAINLICVTNEVGLGIVPENPLARRYRDLVGSANQYLGKKANHFTLVSCGVPIQLKG